MMVMVLTLVAVAVALKVVVIALRPIILRNIEQKATCDLEANVIVSDVYTEKYISGRYFITYQFEDGNEKTFSVNRWMYLHTKQGEYGVLKYKGTKLTEFVNYGFSDERYKKIDDPISFRASNQLNASMIEQGDKGLRVYGEIKGLDFYTTSTQPLYYSFNDICCLINMMLEKDAKGFLCLQNDMGDQIEFSNEGHINCFEVRIPANGDINYQGIILSDKLKTCVKCFFNGQDIITQYNLIQQ